MDPLQQQNTSNGLAWINQLAGGISAVGTAVNQYEAQRMEIRNQQMNALSPVSFSVSGSGTGINMNMLLMVGLAIGAVMLLKK